MSVAFAIGYLVVGSILMLIGFVGDFLDVLLRVTNKEIRHR